MKWNHIIHAGQEYDLSHLRDFTFSYVQDAKDGKPTLQYGVDIGFSWHCYTKTTTATDEHRIHSNAENRCFCEERYRHSAQLPAIIATLGNRLCRQSGRGNYFTVELITEGGNKFDYEVYFSLTKPGKKQNLRLFVESAYVRSERDLYRSKKKKIRFSILLYKVKNSQKISI